MYLAVPGPTRLAVTTHGFSTHDDCSTSPWHASSAHDPDDGAKHGWNGSLGLGVEWGQWVESHASANSSANSRANSSPNSAACLVVHLHLHNITTWLLTPTAAEETADYPKAQKRLEKQQKKAERPKFKMAR